MPPTLPPPPRPQARYDDQRGPVALTLLLAGVTLLAVILTAASLAW